MKKYLPKRSPMSIIDDNAQDAGFSLRGFAEAVKTQADRWTRALKYNPASGATRTEYFTFITHFDADGVRRADPIRDAELLDIYHGTCAKSGLRPGKLLVVDAKIPNAACMSNGTIGVTAGLVDTLTPAELEGVMAHELGHKKHMSENLLMPRVVGFLTAVAGAIVTTKWRDMINPGRWQNMGDGWVKWARYTVTAISDTLPGLLAGWLAQKITVAKHSQEYERQADAEAVRATGNPEALASGLMKLKKRALHIRQLTLETHLEDTHGKIAALPVEIPDLPNADAEIKARTLSQIRQRDEQQRLHGSHPPTEDRVTWMRRQPVTQGDYRSRVRQEAAMAAAAAEPGI